MKKATKINIKRLVFAIEKKYGESPLSDFLLSYLDTEDKRSYYIRYPEFYHQIADALDPQHSTDVSAVVDKMPERDYSYSELRNFHSYATLAAITSLDLPIPSEELLALCAEFLKNLAAFEAEELYIRLSRAEISLQSSSFFEGCDEATQNEIRDKVVKTSKKLGITENEAAMLFIERDPFEREGILGARLYFPVMFVLTSLLIILSLIVSGSIAICFFLTIPLYICSKGLTDYIFSLFVKPVPIPKKKLKSIPDNARTLTVITALISGSDKDLEPVHFQTEIKTHFSEFFAITRKHSTQNYPPTPHRRSVL